MGIYNTLRFFNCLKGYHQSALVSNYSIYVYPSQRSVSQVPLYLFGNKKESYLVGQSIEEYPFLLVPQFWGNPMSVELGLILME